MRHGPRSAPRPKGMSTTLCSGGREDVQLCEVRSRYSPYVDLVWSGLDGPVTRSHVCDADPSLGSAPYSGQPWSKMGHAARIRWLAEHGWSDPIVLDWSQDVPVVDGNHRLCAALWRGDKEILTCSG